MVCYVCCFQFHFRGFLVLLKVIFVLFPELSSTGEPRVFAFLICLTSTFSAASLEQKISKVTMLKDGPPEQLQRACSLLQTLSSQREAQMAVAWVTWLQCGVAESVSGIEVRHATHVPACIYIYIYMHIGGPLFVFFAASFFWRVPGSIFSCFCFFASLLFCFFASLLFCFSAFPASLLVYFSAFLLLCFSASLLLCFFASLLFCFSRFFACLLFCFSASLLLCFCAFLLLLFYLFFSSVMCFAALLPAPLLLCFLCLVPLCFCFLLLYSILFLSQMKT